MPVVVDVPKTAAGFGMIIGPDGTVSAFNGTSGAAEVAGVPLGHKITAVNGVTVASKADIVAQLGAAQGSVAFTLADVVDSSEFDLAAAAPAPPRPLRPARSSLVVAGSEPTPPAPAPAPSAEEGSADIDPDVLAAEARFGGNLTATQAFAIPGRRVVRTGKLKKHNTKGRTNDYEFLLFNDIVIYASITPVTGTCKLHGLLQLKDCRVTVLDLGLDPEQTCFMLENPKKPFRCEAKNQIEAEEWRMEIEAAIVEAGGTKSNERRKVGAGAECVPFSLSLSLSSSDLSSEFLSSSISLVCSPAQNDYGRHCQRKSG